MTTMYERLGVNWGNLGCVMLDIVDPGWAEKVPEVLWYHPTDEDRIILKEPTDNYGMEERPHVTLLYGLLENANIWRPFVDEVMDGWEIPNSLDVDKFDVFKAHHGLYEVVVAKIRMTPHLQAANQRLKRLPHIETFPYVPHVTIGYVHPGTGAYIARDLNDMAKKNTQYVAPTVLNYGRLPVGEQERA